MNYWEECIAEAFEECKIEASNEQIQFVASCVEGAHENYGMATGLDVVAANHLSEAEIELNELKKSIEAKERWVNSTEPCRLCSTTGSVLDGWGRDVTCPECGGRGRV